MKKILLALLLLTSPALAANPTCPTRPIGDSTNACASTAFVQQNQVMGANVVGSNAALSALSSTAGSAIRTGVTTNGDSPIVNFIASGSACTLNAGAGDVGSQVPINSGIGGGCWLGQIQTVDTRIWGAKNDGVTDDTAADQAAINYALADPTNAKTLIVAGTSLVTSSLIVNRAVNQSINDFIIQGVGKSPGFTVGTAITIFDSSTSFSSSPVSERITFDNITFQSSSAATAAYVISNKFLRVNFLNVSFYKIKTVTSSIYLQSWTFQGGYAGGWYGYFFLTTSVAYSLIFNGVDFEPGTLLGNGISLGGGDTVRMVNNTFEGGGQFFYEAGGAGVVAIGNYLEGNASPDFTFADNSLGGVATGVLYIGNAHRSDLASYPVVLGASTGMSSGNYSTSTLFDDTYVVPGNFTSIGDTTLSGLSNVGNVATNVPTGMLNRTSTITAHAGGGQSSAVLLTTQLNGVTTCGVGGVDSVKLPPSLSYAIGYAITISNQCPYSIQVFGSGTDSINFSAYGTGVTQASSAIVTYYNDAAGRWSK